VKNAFQAIAARFGDTAAAAMSAAIQARKRSASSAAARGFGTEVSIRHFPTAQISVEYQGRRRALFSLYRIDMAHV